MILNTTSHPVTPPSHTPLSDYIRQFCYTNNISLDTLAGQSNIARGTLYRLLNQTSQPKIGQLFKLANTMGVHHTVLLNLALQQLGVIHSPNRPNLPIEQGGGYDACGFIDETIPDGTMMAVGAQFDKTWTLQNIGNIVWRDSYLLCLDEPYHTPCCDNGYKLANHKADKLLIALPTIAPKEIITIRVRFITPAIAGRYVSYWQMVDEHGQFCYPDAVGVSVQVLVVFSKVCSAVLADGVADGVLFADTNTTPLQHI